MASLEAAPTMRDHRGVAFVTVASALSKLEQIAAYPQS